MTLTTINIWFPVASLEFLCELIFLIPPRWRDGQSVSGNKWFVLVSCYLSIVLCLAIVITCQFYYGLNASPVVWDKSIRSRQPPLPAGWQMLCLIQRSRVNSHVNVFHIQPANAHTRTHKHKHTHTHTHTRHETGRAEGVTFVANQLPFTSVRWCFNLWLSTAYFHTPVDIVYLGTFHQVKDGGDTPDESPFMTDHLVGCLSMEH